MRQIGDEYRVDPFDKEQITEMPGPVGDFSAHY